MTFGRNIENTLETSLYAPVVTKSW